MSCSSTVRVGSVGLRINRTELDQNGAAIPGFSTALLIQYRMKKPSGVVVDFIAGVVDDPDGPGGKSDRESEYVTQAADEIDEAGTWTCQTIIHFAGGDIFYSGEWYFEAADNLPAPE